MARRRKDPDAAPRLHQVQPRTVGPMVGHRYKGRATKLRYQHKTDEWEGTTADGRTVHVANSLYWDVYHSILRDKDLDTKTRGDRLIAMTHSDDWAKQAEESERKDGFVNPSLYITGG